MADTFPTKNWQWPEGTPPYSQRQADAVAAAKLECPDCGPCSAVAIVNERLYRDRDELLAALEFEHEIATDRDGDLQDCPTCALIARIRAGK